MMSAKFHLQKGFIFSVTGPFVQRCPVFKKSYIIYYRICPLQKLVLYFPVSPANKSPSRQYPSLDIAHMELPKKFYASMAIEEAPPRLVPQEYFTINMCTYLNKGKRTKCYELSQTLCPFSYLHHNYIGSPSEFNILEHN